MANRLGEPCLRDEAQPPSAHLSYYFDFDATGLAPPHPVLDGFPDMIDSTIFENHGNTDAPLQNNTRSVEAALTSPGVSPTSAASSPAVHTQSLQTSLASSAVAPAESTGWPAETIIETSLASPTTDPGHPRHGPGWMPGSLAWTRRKSGTSGQGEKGFIGKNSGQPTVPKSTIHLSPENVISTNPNITFDPQRAVATSPRSPESPRGASPSHVAQPQQSCSQTQPPPPPPQPRPDKRLRNRTAATRNRAKAKAATEELVATEKAQSLRHQELCATLRGLQEEAFALKSELLQHGNCGDIIIQEYLKNKARLLVVDGGTTADSEQGNASSTAHNLNSVTGYLAIPCDTYACDPSPGTNPLREPSDRGYGLKRQKIIQY